MTIKEFANLCECNPQTLRYYDSIDLLKPVNVDPWTGYRHYDESQGETYVKIKNLQKAGFTIDEIRELLDQDDRVIYDAFEKKVEEAEARLREIKLIRQSYQSEMSTIQSKINAFKERILSDVKKYDPAVEFGLSNEEYENTIAFSGTLLNLLLMRNPGINKSLVCNVDPSKDGQNHFKLYRKRTE